MKNRYSFHIQCTRKNGICKICGVKYSELSSTSIILDGKIKINDGHTYCVQRKTNLLNSKNKF